MRRIQRSNVVVLFAFCKGLIRGNTVLRQKSNPQKIHLFIWQQKAIPIEINWIDLTMSALFGPDFSVWRAYTEVNFGQDSFRYVQIHRFFRKKCWYFLCIWRFLCYFGHIQVPLQLQVISAVAKLLVILSKKWTLGVNWKKLPPI